MRRQENVFFLTLRDEVVTWLKQHAFASRFWTSGGCSNGPFFRVLMWRLYFPMTRKQCFYRNLFACQDNSNSHTQIFNEPFFGR